MPTVLRKYGYRFHFYGFDMSEPKHIHVTGQGAKAKIWLDPIELVDARGFNASDIRRIMDVVREHEDQFVEAWNEFSRSVL